MKTLVVTHSLHPIGGAEISVRTAIDALASRGVEVVGLSADLERPGDLTGLAAWHSLPDVFISSVRPRQLARCARAVRALQMLLDRERFDLASLHLVDSPLGLRALVRALPTIRFVHTAWPYCPAGTRWLRRSNVACEFRPGLRCLVVDAHERCLTTSRGERFGIKSSLRRIADMRIHAWAMRHASVVAANSEYTARQIERLIGPADHVRVLSPPIPRSRAAAREPVSGRLLYAGRLVPEKGCAHAIRLVAAVPDAMLAVAGDGPERDALQELARSLGVADRVAFLGWLERGQLDDEMQKAEVVLFPSFWPEPFGQVGPQAASNARPVVAYAVGGVTSWLSAESGALVPPGDLDALIRATRDLLRHPARARRLGRNARDVGERFVPEAFADALILASRDAIRAGARPSGAGSRGDPGGRPRRR